MTQTTESTIASYITDMLALEEHIEDALSRADQGSRRRGAERSPAARHPRQLRAACAGTQGDR